MDLNIKGLLVRVTAGVSGIGLAIARAFLAESARVHICDVTAPADPARRANRRRPG
jgi:NAD(P)-dependent dehydrogenase (short-subunit alcohol dehydrogenase family)